MYICMHICSDMRSFLPQVLYTVLCIFKAGLLARSQFASGRSCDWPTQSRFSVVLLGPRANAELVPKFHVALHASHAAFPMVTSQILPYTNVTDPQLQYHLNLNLRDCTANYRPTLSSERAPYVKKKETHSLNLWDS
jgi:hypothetical protein